MNRRHFNPHPTLLLAALIVFSLILLAPLYVWKVTAGRIINLHAGVFAAFLGFVYFNVSVVIDGLAVSSLFVHLVPVFVSILSALLLSEQPSWSTWPWCLAASR